MIKKFKLKHLPLILSEKIDYAKLMLEVGEFKDTWLNRRIAFIKNFNKTYSLIEEVKNINPQEIELDKDCKIKLPSHIDDITFIAMMELNTILNSNIEVKEMLGDVIAISCFSENYKVDFDIDSNIYKDFRKQVDETPVVEIFGLYNEIVKKLKESKTKWDKAFLEVEVFDADFDLAGGRLMSKFNVINSIKTICQDFNLTYDKAWQMPYSLVQTNSLAKATQTNIQNELSKIKENKMKINRR